MELKNYRLWVTDLKKMRGSLSENHQFSKCKLLLGDSGAGNGGLIRSTYINLQNGSPPGSVGNTLHHNTHYFDQISVLLRAEKIKIMQFVFQHSELMCVPERTGTVESAATSKNVSTVTASLFLILNVFYLGQCVQGNHWINQTVLKIWLWTWAQINIKI